MGIKKIIILFWVLMSLVLVFVNLVLAEEINLPFWGPILSCNTQRIENGGGWMGKYSNPCRSLCDLLATFQRTIYFAITLALFVLAPILFIIGGFLMVISGGNQERIKKGKSVFTNTAWGVVIVLVAFIIINTFFVVLAPKMSGDVNFTKWNEISCSPSNLPGTIDGERGPLPSGSGSDGGRRSRGVTDEW